ncbi:family 43 glycosylhydrolase [Sphingomonas nostoxanthinifaciens]|uniref:family 43 glycosylhydrolase n=1 Tax=Sphingomonas nostoxanthinifaciens TaxID=2872652 RepID=UPI001CC1FA23|nr:family 43 glycosylhydrolase [Sphingomonas nostoxanthinifaciens]UAK23303.1 family 43 glycosylhydrolase [Sphingomonas nostoxanthinifaciens]
MPISRRTMLEAAALSLAGTAPVRAASPACRDGAAPATGWRPGIEGQRRADLGDGRYLNPIVSGDRADPNVLKDGADYYATFSSFDHYPGIIIWHSRDLVNWQPIGPALRTPIGSVWALDIAKHDGRYFIYIPVFVPPTPEAPSRSPFRVYVIHADSMHGPWSEPHDMAIEGYIDPGHAVGEDGRRYLFLGDGHRVRLSDDGLSKAGPIEKVYDGWPIPPDWVVEGFALEGPKVLRRGGYFYLFSGEGGTAGPPTSHMVIVARARSILGPWENCPHNPIVHTASRTEPWWSRGHATPLEAPDGSWWLIYHGYENGLRTLGRQVLLEPFTWTADGWPKATGGILPGPLPKPRGAVAGAHGFALSTDFAHDTLGTALTFFKPQPGYLERARFGAGGLRLKGQGSGPADASPLAMIVGEPVYRVTVDLEVHDGGEGGLLLFYDDKLFCGVGVTEGKLHSFQGGTRQMWPARPTIAGRRVHLRVVNDREIVTFSYSEDGTHWAQVVSFEVSGYNHNMGGGFLSLRPAIYAAGPGEVQYRSLAFAAGA